MKRTRIPAILLIIALLLPTLSGCDLFFPKTPAVSQENPIVADKKTGVSVAFDPCLLAESEPLEVSVSDAGKTTAENGDWQINAYDVSVGDLHELDTYIEIRIPYDDKFCEAGEDPAKCVAAKYLNPETNEWEDVLYSVDAENKQLVIDTNHLSTFGSFEVKNEGMRSAYITEVHDYSYVSSDLAKAAMQEWGTTGEAGDACMKVADVYIQDLVKDVALKSAGEAGDIAGNLYTVTQMGDFQFDTKWLAEGNEKFGKAIGRLGKIAAAANITYTILNSEKTPEDIANLYKDCFNFALSFSEEAALGISMVGVWVIDKSLNKFGEEVQSMRMATVAPIYRYFNDKFDGNSDNYKGMDRARTSLEWIQYLHKLTKACHGDQETFKLLLDSEVDDYARRWFNLPIGRQEDYAHYIQTIVKDGSTAGSYWYSALSDSEKETMIGAYKAELYDRLKPMMNKVRMDNYKELQKQQMDALKDVQSLLNTNVNVKIHEVTEDGAEPQFAEHIIRFSKLNDLAVKKNWTGKLDKNGAASTNFTAVAWMLVGSPKELNVYEKDAKPDTDEPILTAPFVFDFNGIDIPIDAKRFPTIDEICGVYEGLLTVTDYTAPEEVKKAMSEAGCNLDALVGEGNEMKLPISKTGDTTVVFTPEDGDGKPVPMTYDEKTGKLVSERVSEDSAAMTFDLQCAYDEKKETILLSGTVIIEMLGEYNGVKMNCSLLGNKAIG